MSAQRCDTPNRAPSVDLQLPPSASRLGCSRPSIHPLASHTLARIKPLVEPRHPRPTISAASLPLIEQRRSTSCPPVKTSCPLFLNNSRRGHLRPRLAVAWGVRPDLLHMIDLMLKSLQSHCVHICQCVVSHTLRQ